MASYSLVKHHGWTYCLYSNSSGGDFAHFFVIKNTGSEHPMQINSITTPMGVGKSGKTYYTKNTSGSIVKGSTVKGGAISGTNNEGKYYLEINGKPSRTVSVTKQVSGYSGRGGVTPDINGCDNYTFIFDDKPIIECGASANVKLVVASGNNANCIISTEYKCWIQGARTFADESGNSSANVSDYIPYRKPTISILSATAIGRHDASSIQVRCSSNGSGDDTATTVEWTVNNTRTYPAYTYNTYNNISNGEGYLSDAGNHWHRFNSPNYYQPSEAGVGDASTFQVKAKRIHSATGEYAEATVDVRTYRTPNIYNFAINKTSISGNDSVSCSWTSNSRRWGTNLEQDFTTTLEVTKNNWTTIDTSKSVNQAPAGENVSDASCSVTLDKSYLDKLISASERGVDYVTVKVRAKRKNVSSGVVATSGEKSFNIYYKPNKQITSLKFQKESSSGEVISAGSNVIVSEVSNIYVSWAYPSDGMGIISGYIVEVYDSDNKKVVSQPAVLTTNTKIAVSSLTVSKMHTIKITPYYQASSTLKYTGKTLTSSFVIPYRKPTISSLTSSTKIGKHDKNSIDAYVCKNTSGDPADTVVKWLINGTHTYTALDSNGKQISNNEGYLKYSSHGDRPKLFRPSESNIGEATEFTIKVTRTLETISRSVDASITAKTYRIPKIRNLVVSPANFSGYGNTTCTWETNGSKWESSLEKDFKTFIEMSTDNWSSVDTISAPTRQSGSESYVKQTLNLDRTYIENRISASTRNTSNSVSAKLRVRRRNVSASENSTSEGNVDAVSNEASVTVQFVPKYSPIASSLKFRKENQYGSVITPGDNIMLSKESSYYTANIYVSWDYPDSADRGIVDGYIVRIYDDVTKNCIRTYVVSAKDQLSASKTIPTADLAAGRLNTIEVTAYYLRPNGSKAEGPILKSDFVTPVSALDKPSIDYPAHNSEWINKNYRILMKLPEDPDINQFSSDIQNNYVYGDIELKVNGVVYSFLSNPEIFSTATVSYKKAIAINPSLMSTYPSASSYVLQVRVRKNYGFLASTNISSWSDWSAAVTVKVKTDSFSVNRGDLIMASHYNTLQPLCKRMKQTYPIPNESITCKTVVRGQIIKASDYVPPYNDIKGIEKSVNEYAKYDSNRTAVKFPEVPVFTPIVGEFITAKSIDTTFPGRNYIALMHDYANMLK